MFALFARLQSTIITELPRCLITRINNIVFTPCTGLPVVSPIFFNYLDDENTLSIEKQFMFGSGIMVAPILDPVSVQANSER